MPALAVATLSYTRKTGHYLLMGHCCERAYGTLLRKRLWDVVAIELMGHCCERAYGTLLQRCCNRAPRKEVYTLCFDYGSLELHT